MVKRVNRLTNWFSKIVINRKLTEYKKSLIYEVTKNREEMIEIYKGNIMLI